MFSYFNVNVSQADTLSKDAPMETETYTVHAQSESEAKRKAQAIASARDYEVKRFNWIQPAKSFAG